MAVKSRSDASTAGGVRSVRAAGLRASWTRLTATCATIRAASTPSVLRTRRSLLFTFAPFDSLLAVALVKRSELIQVDTEQFHAGKHIRQVVFDELTALERQRPGRSAVRQEVPDAALCAENFVVLQPGQRFDHR